MANTVRIGVKRIFGFELSKAVPDEDVAMELHTNRKDALHEVFDGQVVQVKDWGQTDDTQPHEYIELVVDVGTFLWTNPIVIPVAKWIFEKLADKALDGGLDNFFSWLLPGLRKKQEEKKIGDVQIQMPNGFVVNIYKPENGGNIQVFGDGKVSEIRFTT